MKKRINHKENILSWALLMLLIGLFISCEHDQLDANSSPITNQVLEDFHDQTGLTAVYYMDTTLLNTVRGWQGQGDYPGVDDWTTAKVANNFDFYGGLPGQSQYYTISNTLIDSDTIEVTYWESLQVKPHPQFGFRPMVGIYEMLEDTIIVAISKTLANPQYGQGGAWQLYVQDYQNDLMVTDTIYLKQ